MVLALVVHRRLKKVKTDVKSAFLNGRLEEELYTSQPSSFAVKGQEQQLIRLHKSLYGLRQEARAWNEVLCKSFALLGLSKSS